MLTKRLPRLRTSMLRYSVSILAACLTAALAYAGEGYFGYDEFGRILRSIDEQSRATEYSYDPAGNITGIRTGLPAPAPTISTVTPNNLRRSESRVMKVTGANLLGVSITSTDSGLHIDKDARYSTDTSVTFTLTATAVAIIGQTALTFTTKAGSTQALVTVNPAMPSVITAPAPLAVPPDSVTRQFALRLSHADTIPHSLMLSVADPTLAMASSTVSIPAGATEASVQITGLKAGETLVTMASNTLGTSVTYAYVANDYAEMNKSRAKPLGIVVQEPATTVATSITPFAAPLLGVLKQEPVAAPASVTISPMVAASVGVALGGVVTGMTPNTAAVGQTFALTVNGVDLHNVTAVQFSANTGITVYPPVIASDGRSLSVNVSIAADAPQMLRQVQVIAGSALLPTSPESLTQFRVTP